MFRKLHIQMTIFSTLITGTILIAMTLACLFIAESGTRQNSYTAFANNASSCITHLEGQSLISHQWILQVCNAYGIRMEIKDNGKPLFFEKLNPSGESPDSLITAAEISKDTYGLDLENLKSVSQVTKSTVFETRDFYACTALIPRVNGVLSLEILYPLEPLKIQIYQQRLAFGCAVLIAVLALAAFSWFFTRKMIRPLEESRKQQTEFIASASHELRSPLAVIQSSISAMEKAPSAEAPHFTEIIKKESSRMGRLINDMLSLANADNHSWSLVTAPCELDTLMLETYEKYEPLARRKMLHLDVLLPEEHVEPCLCDAARISQVLSILMDNALSYVPSQGCITLALEQNDKNVFLSVADNGPGIPDESRESIFLRFYRADTSRNDKQHFGLGLCIAKEIVQLHSGTIQVKDAPGGGAVFLIRLPKYPHR
ncbi:MAG: HAMP domain-containing sensor histidine kinase [Eubacteriales bacterium]|nr:HAMP domain-containing sensor histidine kinase [Eubacteriales bacterium]